MMRLKRYLTALLIAIGCFSLFTDLRFASAQNDQERYSVQFRLPLDKNEVWNFVEMISGLGYPSYMYTEGSEDGRTCYYAQMGSYPSIIDAIDAASTLNRKVSVEFDVVHTNTNTIVKLDTKTSKPVAPNSDSLKAISDKSTHDIATPETPALDAPTLPQVPEPPKSPAAPVVATATNTQASAVAPLTAPSGGKKIYLLQIFSFQVLNNAVQTAKNYKTKGYDPFIIKLYDASDKEWFVVSIGYADTQEQAAVLAQRFAQKEGKRPTLNNVDAEFLKTRIVPYD